MCQFPLASAIGKASGGVEIIVSKMFPREPMPTQFFFFAVMPSHAYKMGQLCAVPENFARW